MQGASGAIRRGKGEGRVRGAIWRGKGEGRERGAIWREECHQRGSYGVIWPLLSVQVGGTLSRCGGGGGGSDGGSSSCVRTGMEVAVTLVVKALAVVHGRVVFGFGVDDGGWFW